MVHEPSGVSVHAKLTAMASRGAQRTSAPGRGSSLRHYSEVDGVAGMLTVAGTGQHGGGGSRGDKRGWRRNELNGEVLD
jgi:hypothetical protein